MFKILFTLLLTFYTTNTYSHSQLKDIFPNNNIVYTKIPSKIDLKFRSKVKLIKIYLNKISANNNKIKINLKNHSKRAKNFKLPMPDISSGKYNIFWRALSPDGHIIKGKSKFEVK